MDSLINLYAIAGFKDENYRTNTVKSLSGHPREIAN